VEPYSYQLPDFDFPPLTVPPKIKRGGRISGKGV